MTGPGFFDFHERVTAKRPVARPAAPAGGVEAMTVHQLTARIEAALKSGLPSSVHVRGELSNVNPHRGSGHLYFTLKDDKACIDCVMFRSDASRLKFTPEDGIELIVTGRVAVYAQRGRYQLYATSMQPLGRGALELAFRQLQAKLQAEGLFAAERKKPLPRFPLHIALVTSRQTAALQDMLKVLRRYPWLRLWLYHVSVQGQGAAEQIARAIGHLDEAARQLGGVDVILLGRGGGSLEDLWPFNEEVVARAMARCRIPIISGIGHEVDVSIADLVADFHAHTPTEAAQVAVNHWRVVAEQLAQAHRRLARGIAGLLEQGRRRLEAVQRHEIFRRPTDRIDQLRQLLDDRERQLHYAQCRRIESLHRRLRSLEQRLIQAHPRHEVRQRRLQLSGIEARLALAMRGGLARRRERVAATEAHLNAVSPERVLQRGYSITLMRKDGTIVRAASQVKPGDRLLTRLADGTVESSVHDQRQLPLFE